MRAKCKITDQVLSTTSDSVDARIEEIRDFVETGAVDLRGLLNRDVTRAKFELRRHLHEVRMIPTQGQDTWHYLAEGTWDLFGADSGVDQTCQPSGWRMSGLRHR
jgi:hypothetical protein